MHLNPILIEYKHWSSKMFKRNHDLKIYVNEDKVIKKSKVVK